MGCYSSQLVNRPLRTRMRGDVGAVGEKPTATRLGKMFVYFTILDASIISHVPQSNYTS